MLVGVGVGVSVGVLVGVGVSVGVGVVGLLVAVGVTVGVGVLVVVRVGVGVVVAVPVGVAATEPVGTGVAVPVGVRVSVGGAVGVGLPCPGWHGRMADPGVCGGGDWPGWSFASPGARMLKHGVAAAAVGSLAAVSTAPARPTTIASTEIDVRRRTGHLLSFSVCQEALLPDGRSL